MSNCAMSNETDLDWLARNVHVWPAGDHQPWCYVYWKGGLRAVSGNCITVIQPCVRVEMSEWIARRAELQNKPTEWPKRANWLAQHEDGEWAFYSDSADNPPQHRPDGNWYSDDVAVKCFHSGEVLGDWRDTLEKRPEEFQPFTSIEDNQEKDMKQDSGWFERGGLPPVGAVCEIFGKDASPEKCKIIAYHKDQVAVQWESFGGGILDVLYLRGDYWKFRPIRTERDVLMDIIKQWDGLVQTDEVLADAILAAGFSRRDK